MSDLAALIRQLLSRGIVIEIRLRPDGLNNAGHVARCDLCGWESQPHTTSDAAKRALRSHARDCPAKAERDLIDAIHSWDRERPEDEDYSGPDLPPVLR